MENKKIQEEYIRKMLKSVASEDQISAEVEPAVMKKVAERKEYSEQIKMYRRRAKYAFLISAVFLLLFGISSTLELMTGADDPVQVISFSAFAVGGIVFTFVALQISPKKV